MLNPGDTSAVLSCQSGAQRNRIKACLTVRGGQQYPGFIMDAAVREYVWRFMGLGGTCSRCGSGCALTGRCRTEDHMLLCRQLTCRVGSPGRTVTHTKCRSSPAMTNYTLAAHLSSQTSCRQSVRAREGWMLRMRGGEHFGANVRAY